MANKIEQIAAKKKQAELAKQESEVAAFARRVANEVIGTDTLASTDDLKSSIATLATTVAEAIIASNATFDSQLNDNFTQLLAAVKDNKPNNTNLTQLNKEIGHSLAKFETALNKIQLAPEITVEGLQHEQLKTEIDKILARLPENSKREITIAYEQTSADKYINVRLTDGIKFYTAFAGGARGGGLVGGATEAKQDEIITAIEGIAGATNYTTRIETVGTLTYIGNAIIGSAEGSSVWQIKRLETPGLTKLWADGNDSFDNIWANRASLAYS